MTTVPVSVPGSEFDDFLFAPIGEDRNGMLVSVLSGLARSDVDPWQEAAKLAQLPGEIATKQLATLIGALPHGAASYPDPRGSLLAWLRSCRARLGSMARRKRRRTAFGR